MIANGLPNIQRTSKCVYIRNERERSGRPLIHTTPRLNQLFTKEVDQAMSKKIFFGVVTLLLAIGSSSANAASETLSQYVNACKTQLNIQNVSIPDLNCYDGDLFAPSPTPDDPDTGIPTNDYVGFRKLTDQVELVFACRWLDPDKANPKEATSVELLIHDHQSGNTCYFSAIRDTSTLHSVPSTIVSPFSASAASYWAQPADVSANVPCIGCHISGPYIATPLIAPYLAKYGLLNNGHDTGSNITSNDLTQSFNKSHVKYHAIVTTGIPNVTSAFSQWDNLKQSYMDPGTNANSNPEASCSIGCHVIGSLSPQSNVTFPLHGAEIILGNVAQQLYTIDNAGVMPPVYDDDSDYRWINLDTPGDGVESESFAAALGATNTLIPQLFNYGTCSRPNVPMQLEAHAVGVPNDYAFTTQTMALIPDRLRTFNLKEGLVCLNSDQEQGQSCHDYTIRYLCSVSSVDGTPTWSNWYSHPLVSDGDHEERSKDTNICGGVAPIAIQTQFYAGGTSMYIMGPNDRLARFSAYGLTCNASDQVDNQCSNYVVRYDYCSLPPPVQHNKTLTNVYAVGKQVTAASGSLAKGQSHNGGTTQQWNTQQWDIEPVTNTEYVRIHNVPTNIYLTVTSTAEQATVGTAASNSSTNEMWTIETISGSSAFRLKNLASGRYLTIADPRNFPSTPDYLPIYSQALNTGWTSQAWIIQ